MSTYVIANFHLENVILFYIDCSVISNILVKKQTSALQAFNEAPQGPQYATQSSASEEQHCAGDQHSVNQEWAPLQSKGTKLLCYTHDLGGPNGPAH